MPSGKLRAAINPALMIDTGGQLKSNARPEYHQGLISYYPCFHGHIKTRRIKLEWMWLQFWLIPILCYEGEGFLSNQILVRFLFQNKYNVPAKKKRKKIVQKIAVLIITIQEILKSFSLALEIHYMRCFSDHFDCFLCWFKLTFTLMLHSVSLCDSRVDQMAERRQLDDSNGPPKFAKWETLMLRIGLSV